MKANVARRNGKRCGQTYYKATTLIGSSMCLLLSNDVILDDLEAGFRVKPGNNVEKLPPPPCEIYACVSGHQQSINQSGIFKVIYCKVC